MRIALITKRLSESLGGAERVSASLARALRNSGHEVHIVTGSADQPPEGVFVHEIDTGRWLSPWRLLSFQRKAGKLVRQLRTDIVYSLCQVYPVDIYRVGDGIHIHWMKLLHPDSLRRGLTYATSLVHLVMVWLERQIFSRGNCKFFITNSRLVRDQVMDYYQVPENRIRVIYNGVDHGVFNPDVRKHRQKMRGDLHFRDEDLVLLFVANNWERKGLATIIRAMARNSGGESKLVVVGRGKRSGYDRLIDECGLGRDRFRFIGRSKDVEQWYGMADVFILPTHYEPFSNVCLEAMACGLPVITTRGNGASELIHEEENGFILDQWTDEVRLAELLTGLKDDGLRKTIGEEASRTARQFTWERHIEETMQVFHELAGTGAASADN